MQLPTTSLSTQLTQPNLSLLRTQSFLKIKQSSFAFMREWVTAPFIFSSRCPSMAFCPQSSRGAEFQFVPVANKASNTRSHRRTRADSFSPIGGPAITEPGDCVSVDQLKSSTPGLIGQVKGWLTQERHHTATVFVDHHSDLTFVHVTPSDTSEETVSAKEAFECFAASHDVTVKHYHADNGCFADSLFRDHVKEKGQTISFCGVGAHHQNGKVEKRIRDTMEQARTMLLHASHRWPKAISASLWPYALHHAVNIRNNVTSNPDGISPLAKFSKHKVKNTLFWKHQHTFGCPVFVLEAPLQGSIGGKGKLARQSPNWHLPWSLQAALLLSCSGPQSQDWACLSTVPCCV